MSKRLRLFCFDERLQTVDSRTYASTATEMKLENLLENAIKESAADAEFASFPAVSWEIITNYNY